MESWSHFVYYVRVSRRFVLLPIRLVGYPPFNDSKPLPVFEQIKQGDYDFPEEHWSEVSEEAKHLIRQLLTVSPSERSLELPHSDE